MCVLFCVNLREGTSLGWLAVGWLADIMWNVVRTWDWGEGFVTKDNSMMLSLSPRYTLMSSRGTRCAEGQHDHLEVLAVAEGLIALGAAPQAARLQRCWD